MQNSNSKVEPTTETAITQNRLLADVADSLEFIADSLSEEVLLRQMIDDWCIKQLGNTDKALDVADKMFTAARDIFYNVSSGGSNTLLPAVGSSLKIGDVLRIKDNREFNSLGVVDFPIVDMDGHSFAVQDDLLLKWWFYKDTLTPYAGNADVLGVVPQ